MYNFVLIDAFPGSEKRASKTIETLRALMSAKGKTMKISFVNKKTAKYASSGFYYYARQMGIKIKLSVQPDATGYYALYVALK